MGSTDVSRNGSIGSLGLSRPAGLERSVFCVMLWLLTTCCWVTCATESADAQQVDAVIDFEFQPAGTIVDMVFGAATPDAVGPVALNGTLPSNPVVNSAVLFDSANPTGGDIDLGTPNEDFGGPGMGPAGEQGQPNENSIALGNLLIFAESLTDANNDMLVDDPDDADEFGMVFDFDFTTITMPFTPTDVCIKAVTTIDGEDSESPGVLRLFDAADMLIHSQLLPPTGCNGVIRHVVGDPGIGVCDVARMEIQLNGSGAIDRIEFTAFAPPEEVINLQCALQDACTCTVLATWEAGAPNYDSIRVEVNGITVQTLAGDATSALVTLPGFGMHEICVIPVVGGVDGIDACCTIDCPEIPANPVTDLMCTPNTLDCSVAVSWINNGPYNSIQVLLDGMVVATPGPMETSVLLPGPIVGMHQICVVATNVCDVATPQVCCDIDCAIDPPNPVMDLMCPVDLCSCEVAATWVNGAADYDSIDVTLDGMLLMSLGGGATNFTTTLPGPGVYQLCVTPTRNGVSGPMTCCTVECVEVPATSPANLICSVGTPPTCETTITWENTSLYQSISVSVDGVVVAMLPGSAESASVTLDPGPHEICLNGTTVCDVAFPEVCCDALCPLPPDPITNLVCNLTDPCACIVSLTWTNGNADYDMILVAVNDVVQMMVSGSLESLELTLPNPGISEICLTPVRNTLTADPTCCTVDCPEILALPPSNLQCTPNTLDCSIDVTWTNVSSYSEIVVLLDGMIIETLPGTAQSYTITGPITGMHQVCLQGMTICNRSFGMVCCDFDCMIEPPNPVLDLECVLTDPCTCAVTVTWTNSESNYDALLVFLNGMQIATLPGDAMTTDVTLPAAGTHEICVAPQRNGVTGGQECCMVTCPVTAPFPPDMLVCNTNPADCMALISWQNQSTYSSITVSLNGVVIQTLPGDTEQTTVEITLPGLNEICLNGMTICDEAFPEVCCMTICDGLMPPPVTLMCTVTDQCTCDALASWTVTDNGFPIDEFQVSLDGMALGTVPGGTLSFPFVLPDNAMHELCVVAVQNGVSSMASCCDVQCDGVPVTGVSNLNCEVDTAAGCLATLSWTNTSSYASLTVSINGMVVETLAGTAVGTVLMLDETGTVEICIGGTTVCGDEIETQCCNVQCDLLFWRGECNDDDRGLDIADAIFLLRFFFLGGDAPNCNAACDLNNDGMLNMADAQFIFAFLFMNGPDPDAPFPDCGTVPGADCEMFLSCP